MVQIFNEKQLARLKRAHDSLITNKESHLHKFKPIPNSEGNRAERRAAARKKKKK